MQGIEATQDGRLARSARTRRAIVDALRSLHHDGDLRPTAPRVAERAGVSLRTVFQHFEDLESLLVEAGRVDYEIAIRYVRPVDRSATVEERLRQLIAQRGEMYEALAPVWRAARLQEPFSPQIRSNRDHLMQTGRDQLDALFGAELDRLPASRRDRTLDALQVATSWATWESLRTEIHLAPAAAHKAVLALLSNLFVST
jgi:AcrR family transcriptional regulator